MKTTIELQQYLMFDLPETNFKDEKSFTTWFGRKIHDVGGFRHKMSDQSMDLKPSDAIVGINGVCGLAEIKVGSEKTKVDVFKKLRPNQAFGLRRYKNNGGESIVVYYSKLYHKYWVMTFEEEMLLRVSE